MEFTLALIGLGLSFLFAGSETAFVTTNKIRFELWIRNRIPSALRAEKYFRQPDLFISTTLVGNNIANILATTYATVFLVGYFSETFTWAVITLTLLLIGEIIPKAIFRIFAHSIILIVMYPIRLFHFVLFPVIWIANTISSFFLRLFGMNLESVKLFFSKDDLALLINESNIAGVIEDEEHKIISKVLELPDTLVREAMIPRTQIEAVNSKATVNQVRNLMSKKGYSKIPVFKEKIDNIVGVVFMYDLFANVKSIKDVIKPITYTPENKKCNELLREFKQTNTSISVVIDEYGGTAGMVTTQDLVEELFGEFDDSTENGMQSIKKINKITWDIDAAETIENINEQLNVNLPEEDFETIAGLILSQLGRIPTEGEQMVLHNCRFVIVKSKKNKIELVRLIKRK